MPQTLGLGRRPHTARTLRQHRRQRFVFGSNRVSVHTPSYRQTRQNASDFFQLLSSKPLGITRLVVQAGLHYLTSPMQAQALAVAMAIAVVTSFAATIWLILHLCYEYGAGNFTSWFFQPGAGAGGIAFDMAARQIRDPWPSTGSTGGPCTRLA